MMRESRAFSAWETPAMVPPVPAPHTKACSRPRVWRRISAPVPRCARKLAGFSNWSANSAVPGGSCAAACGPCMRSM